MQRALGGIEAETSAPTMPQRHSNDVKQARLLAFATCVDGTFLEWRILPA